MLSIVWHLERGIHHLVDAACQILRPLLNSGGLAAQFGEFGLVAGRNHTHQGRLRAGARPLKINHK